MIQLEHGAIAIFVKTPGYSPLKTRLAEGIGEERALDFYKLSTRCIADTLKKTQDAFEPYWAVAEMQAVNEWPDFKVLWQGEGDLGNRLHKVYADLLNRFAYVALIGADAPQLSSKILRESLERLKDHDFVIGPAADGGFYLFLGKKALPRSLWTSVTYSKNDTLEALLAKLRLEGSVAMMRTLTDVDTVEDLVVLCDELSAGPSLEENLAQLYEQLQGLIKV